jgi:hypothetical protein
MAHQLTDMQKVEKLLAFPVLGQQKPSELLAEMLRFCPRGEENSFFFNCLFLQKLPRELRVLLCKADMVDKRLLSERASGPDLGPQLSSPPRHRCCSFLRTGR